MILLPTHAIKDRINPYFLFYRRESELLGFWPCSNKDKVDCSYLSVQTLDGKLRIVPVFYDWMDKDGGRGTTPTLLFMGCDDGHLGLQFETRKAALDWIYDCEHVDFNELFKASWSGHPEFLTFN